MGKQIQIFTTDEDNLAFQRFLESNYECAFFQSFAPTKDELQLTNINDTKHKDDVIYIYNTKFKWKPKYERTTTKEKDYYIENINEGPIIELSKTDWENNESGRIYWAKDFVSNKLKYNVGSFDVFYNEVTSWIKKNAKGKTKHSNINSYYLENAWEKYNR